MTIDVIEEFVLLGQAPAPDSPTSITSRPLSLTVEGQAVRLGIDHEGLRHLLVPLGSVDLTPDNASQGVSLRKRVMLLEGVEHTFADLACRRRSLALVFEHVVEDVVGRLVESPSEGGEVCRRVLAEWRELLKVASGEIGRETILGLVGELEVLRYLAESCPQQALNAWVGPSRAVNDFVANGRAIEVKSTAAVDGNFIHVANIDQLDPEFSDELLLAVVHCKESASAPSLDDRIRELIEMGVDKAGLLLRIAKAGYVFESGLPIPAFHVRSVRLWSVDEDFPGLRSADIAPQRRSGVFHISYKLDLDAAGSEPLEGDGLRRRLLEWMG